MANWFEKLRMTGVDSYHQPVQGVIDTGTSNSDLGYQLAVKKAKSTEYVSKGLKGKDLAYAEPLVGTLDFNPDYRKKPSINNSQDLHRLLKRFSKNIILNSIINIRSNQVLLYCKPERYSEKGMGYEIRLKDNADTPTKSQKKKIREIEDFLSNTGVDKDVNRDTFSDFIKKIVRDTYIYDQVNFEKVFDKNSNKLHHFTAVDPSTIFRRVENGKLVKTGNKYAQVIDRKVVTTFSDKDLAFAVRNPRTDIEVSGYGYPEAEIALKQLIAQENTETFNDRFFSHGGTTRGILHLKVGQNQSQQALDIFRQEWKSSLSGINGSWQIPVVSADEVKFVNMTPNANDMQFEKWLNYLINVICAVFVIDPAEINFPNNGGISSKGSGALNEGNSRQKTQASQNKGLLPLLEFIADIVNKFIISEFGDEFIFTFQGGDTLTTMEKIEIIKEEVKVYRTVNEVRLEKGLPAISGGDTILDGVFIQSKGQDIQNETTLYQRKQEKLNKLLESASDTSDLEIPEPKSPEENIKEETRGGKGDDSTFSTQDSQEGNGGPAGNSDKVDGRGTYNKGVGKDGLSKG